MLNSVQHVINICQQRKIPISRLEDICGFHNGYLDPKKLKKIPYDRAQIVATHLGIPVDIILSGGDLTKVPTDVIENFVDLCDVDVDFYGGYKELSEDDQKTIRDMVQLMRTRRAEKEK